MRHLLGPFQQFNKRTANGSRLQNRWINLYLKVEKWANLADNIKFAGRAKYVLEHYTRTSIPVHSKAVELWLF